MGSVVNLGSGVGFLRRGRFVLAIVVLAFAAMFTSSLVSPQQAHAKSGPTVYNCYVYKPLLYQGVRNQEGCTAALQHFLRYVAKINQLAVDGKFGSATSLTVKAWQIKSGLNPDGYVGPQTWTAIYWKCLDARTEHIDLCNVPTWY